MEQTHVHRDAAAINSMCSKTYLFNTGTMLSCAAARGAFGFEAFQA